MSKVTVGGEKLEVVPSFCYLGDCLSSGGGCELVTIKRCRVAWGKFNEPILTSHSFPIASRGRVYNSCVRSSHVLCKQNLGLSLIRLALPAMQWPSYDSMDGICCVTTKDHISMQDLLERMLFDDMAIVLGTRRLRWHSHLERDDGWSKKVQKLNPTGGPGRGRLKKSWTEVIDMDCVALGQTETHLSDRKCWEW